MTYLSVVSGDEGRTRRDDVRSIRRSWRVRRLCGPLLWNARDGRQSVIK